MEENGPRGSSRVALAGGNLDAALLQLPGDLPCRENHVWILKSARFHAEKAAKRQENDLELTFSSRKASKTAWIHIPNVGLILMIIYGLRQLELLELRRGRCALQGLVLQAHVHQLRLELGVLLRQPLDLPLPLAMAMARTAPPAACGGPSGGSGAWRAGRRASAQRQEQGQESSGVSLKRSSKRVSFRRIDFLRAKTSSKEHQKAVSTRSGLVPSFSEVSWNRGCDGWECSRGCKEVLMATKCFEPKIEGGKYIHS